MTEPMTDARLAQIRAEVTGACSCCGYDKHDFDESYALELLAEVDRLRADLNEAATLLGDHLSSEECWIGESGSCIKHGSRAGERCRMPQTRELLKRIHAVQLHPHNAHVGCIYPGCAVPGHRPRTWDYPVGG